MACWTLAVGMTMTAALGWELHREAAELDRQRLAMRVAEIQGQLDARLEKSEMLMNQLRDYLTLSGESRHHVFDRWCYENGLTINCPWILGVAVATNRNIAPWRSPGLGPPASWPNSEWERLPASASENPIHAEIALRRDITNTMQYLPDYDLRCLTQDRLEKYETDRGTLATTVMAGRPGMTRRRTVLLDASSNAITGSLFLVPVYQSELAEFLSVAGRVRNDQRCARWLHLKSVIVAPVDFGALMRSVWEQAPADLGMEIFSSTNQTAETWLNVSGNSPRAADPKFAPYMTHRLVWPMYGDRFSIFFYTNPLFEAQSPRRLARVTMAAGSVVTLLGAVLMWVAFRARDQQKSLVEQIREARDALATAQHERNKISRDLHDGTLQSLYAIQLGLGHTAEKIQADPGKVGRKLSAARAELDAVIAEIRQFITAEAGSGQAVDFSAVLQALIQRARGGTTAEITLRTETEAAARLTGDQSVQLANITREALSNSLRHGQPTRVKIALRLNADTVHLEVTDDGAGFDPTAPGRSGVGLTSMLTRAREMRGTWHIQSAPGKGACITVRVPVAPRDPLEPE